MPTTSLFHPISLYVIRGSLIHCGWTPGRISQLACNMTNGTARYRVAITKVPKQEKDASPSRMKTLLNNCFMEDIEVTEVWHKSDGTITAYIFCDLHRGDENQLTLPEEAFTLENTRIADGDYPESEE